GRIKFSSEIQEWVWNLDDIKKENITDNVVELMTSNILQLPSATQMIVKLASCIGSEFDLLTLVTVSDQDPVEIGKFLWPALDIGIIIPVDDNYKIFGDGTHESLSLTTNNARYNFLHDRIQQAAYSLIPSEDRALIHLNIGRKRLGDKGMTEPDDRLFDILNHLNQGLHLVVD